MHSIKDAACVSTMASYTAPVHARHYGEHGSRDSAPGSVWDYARPRTAARVPHTSVWGRTFPALEHEHSAARAHTADTALQRADAALRRGRHSYRGAWTHEDAAHAHSAARARAATEAQEHSWRQFSGRDGQRPHHSPLPNHTRDNVRMMRDGMPNHTTTSIGHIRAAMPRAPLTPSAPAANPFVL